MSNTTQSQPDTKTAGKDLTAREILDILMAGKSVVIPMGQDSAEIGKLLNHLNVIKSRDKKVYTDLQLEIDTDKVIKLNSYLHNSNGRFLPYTVFSLELPIELKRYSTFTIEELDKANASSQ